MNFPSDQFTLLAKIMRFEERFAVLQHEMLGEIRWPIANLPPDVDIGTTIQLKAATPEVEENEKYERMRKLLQELIN